MEEIIKAENIEATDADVNAGLEKMAAGSNGKTTAADLLKQLQEHDQVDLYKEQLRADWRQIAQSLSDSDAPATRKDYQRHYASYDSAPFAFTDIEMVFNEKRAAVDWIFRYANEALARLEKKPLEQLIDHSFGSIFPNMDDKWLRVYERTALFGETLEIIDHSPEIDTDLKIICFPTFKGHCGCILFKQAEIQTMRVEKPGGKGETGY